MRIYYNAYSTITRYAFNGNLEAIGEISLTPELILLTSLVCYYEDLEEGIPFSGNFKNPKVYKEYRWEICDKYKDLYKARRLYDRSIGEEILINNEWIPIPDDFYEVKRVYLLGELIREDRYYHRNEYNEDFYYTDELIEYYKKRRQLEFSSYRLIFYLEFS